MKLDKAIEIVDSFLLGTYDHRDEDLEDAFKLVIEATRRYQVLRSSRVFLDFELLPGETEK